MSGKVSDVGGNVVKVYGYTQDNVMGDMGVRRAKPSFVYIAERDDRVKIGWSCRPVKRMAELGRGTRLVSVMVGGYRLEQALQRCFAADRLEGEWFAPSPRLRAFIAALPAHVELRLPEHPPLPRLLLCDACDRVTTALVVCFCDRPRCRRLICSDCAQRLNDPALPPKLPSQPLIDAMNAPRGY